MQNSSRRWDINRPRPRRGEKYTESKKCVSTMMLICINQHQQAQFIKKLSNT